MGMKIDVPEGMEALGRTFLEMMARVQAEQKLAATGRAVDYAKVEQEIAEKAGAIEREGHKEILQSLDIDRPAIMIGENKYNRVGRYEATYYTLAGPVEVERSVYRESGQRGGEPEGRVIDTVSVRVGAVGKGWLPQTARAMAHAVQKGTSREAESGQAENFRLPYSRASFESVAHEVGALAVASRDNVQDALIEAYEVPAEARSVSVSLDRVNIPMEEPLPRPVGRPKKNAPKRPVARNFRQAYCATVTLHDSKGEALHTIRYGRMPQGDPAELCDRMVADVLEIACKSPDLKIELLCDGAPELWNLLEERFTTEIFGEVHRLVDYHHLTEKLGAAAKVISPPSEVGATLSTWKFDLLNDEKATQKILAELVASGKEDEPRGEARPVHAAITYLETHSVNTDRMNYARARALGLPVGSGNVEATCKSLFEIRLKRCGSRWKEHTGWHIVQLRAYAISDWWASAIELTLQPLRKAVRYA